MTTGRRHTGDKGPVLVEGGGLQGRERGSGRGLMVTVAVSVVIVGRVVGRSAEEGTHTSSSGGEGDEGAVQGGRSQLGSKGGHGVWSTGLGDGCDSEELSSEVVFGVRAANTAYPSRAHFGDVSH